MDRLITTAWRAFWVALGASVVLVGQAAFFPVSLPAAAPAPAVVTPAPETPAISQRRIVERDRIAVRS